MQKNASRHPAPLFLLATGSKAKQTQAPLSQEVKEAPEAKKCLVCQALFTNTTERDFLCASCNCAEEEASPTAAPLLSTAGSKAKAKAEVQVKAEATTEDAACTGTAGPGEGSSLTLYSTESAEGVYTIKGFPCNKLGGMAYHCFYRDMQICGSNGANNRNSGSISVSFDEISNVKIATLDSFRLDKSFRTQQEHRQRALLSLFNLLTSEGIHELKIPVGLDKDKFLRNNGFVVSSGVLTVQLKGNWCSPLRNATREAGDAKAEAELSPESEDTQPAPDPPLKSPEGTQPAPDPGTLVPPGTLASPEGTQLAPDPYAFVQPFEIVPFSEVEFCILEASLSEAGAVNRVGAIAVDIRKRIIAHQRTKGPTLYQFILSPQDPEAGSGVAGDDLQQVAWFEYLDRMESTSDWGSHLEIQSAAMLFDAKIYIWQLKPTGYVFHSVHGSGKQVWHFGFESERHYHFLLHGSDHEGMRNLVVHLGAAPCISRTTPYRGSSEALLIGVYGDGNCLFSTIGMAALACVHPLVESHIRECTPRPSSLRMHALPNLAENEYMTIDAETRTGELAANAEMLHLCQVSGHPLGEGSVVSDATKASLMMLSAAAAAHSGIAKLHKDIVWVFHLFDRQSYCGARWKAEAIRKASQTGLRLKVTRNMPSSDSFDGFTHVICDDTTSCRDVEKALGSSSVNLVIVVNLYSQEKELSVEVPVDFQLVIVNGTKQHAMFMRVHGVQQPCTPPSPRPISVPSRSFNSANVNVLTTNVDRSAPPKYEVIKNGLKHTVLPNVAATMRRPNGTVTYMPNQYLRLQVDQFRVSVIYRGIVQSGQSDFVIVYDDTRGNIGTAPPNQVRGLSSGFASEKMTSEKIAEGVRAWLKEDVVKRNLTVEFSLGVTLNYP